MRHIAIIVGSKSDLPQCKLGLEYLISKGKEGGLVKVYAFYVRSQHRHTEKVQTILHYLHSLAPKIDAIIAGAGWANHLTGCVDAYFRYTLKNDWTSVIGAAFQDTKSESAEAREHHDHAAVLSITEVPGTQVIYKDKKDQFFFGSNGFLRACQFAVEENLPEIKLKKAPDTMDLSLEEAFKLSC